MKKNHNSMSVLNLLTTSILGSVFLMISFSSEAGGVALGATRLIYPQDKPEISLSMSNSDKNAAYLIQSWMTDERGKKNSDFITTPPLFVMKPAAENTLRLMYAGPGLPTDKESLFFLHSKAIPSVNPNDVKSQNVLQIAIESVIKVLWRPKGLVGTSNDTPKKLSCHLTGNRGLVIVNPTPYYASLINLYVGNKKIDNQTVPPKGEKSISISGSEGGTVTFMSVNDYGASSDKITCPMG